MRSFQSMGAAILLLSVASLAGGPLPAFAAPWVGVSAGFGETVTEPVISGFTIRVDVPETEQLESLTLVFDDTSDDPAFPIRDTRIVVYRRAPQVCTTKLLADPGDGGTTYTLELDLPLWTVGINNLEVVAATTRVGDEEGSFPTSVSASARFVFELPEPSWGLSPDGSFNLPYPISPQVERRNLGGGYEPACGLVFCKDADRDGLLDLWESIVTEVMKPILVFHPLEELFDRPEDHVQVFTRVVPTSFPPRILLVHEIAFTRDYGPGGHAGDVQDVIVALEGGRLHSVWTKGHFWVEEGPIRIPKNRWLRVGPDQLELTAEGSLEIYLELNKHGTWPSQLICVENAVYPCASNPIGSRSLQPVAVNPGEPDHPLLDRLGDIELDGPHAGLLVWTRTSESSWGWRPAFPGEAVWSDLHGNGWFCGGLECTAEGLINESSPGLIGAGLSRLPAGHVARGSRVPGDVVASAHHPTDPLPREETFLHDGIVLQSGIRYAFSNLEFFDDYQTVEVAPFVPLSGALASGVFGLGFSDEEPLRSLLPPVEPAQPRDWIGSRAWKFPNADDDPEISRRAAFELHSSAGCVEYEDALQVNVNSADIAPDQYESPVSNDGVSTATDLGLVERLCPFCTRDVAEHLTLHPRGDVDYFRLQLPPPMAEPAPSSSCSYLACDYVEEGVKPVIWQKRYDPTLVAVVYDSKGQPLPAACRLESDFVRRDCLGDDEMIVEVQSFDDKRNFYALALDHRRPSWNPRAPEGAEPCRPLGSADCYGRRIEIFRDLEEIFVFPGDPELLEVCLREGCPGPAGLAPELFFFDWPGGPLELAFTMQEDLSIVLLNAKYETVTEAWIDPAQGKFELERLASEVRKLLWAPGLEGGLYALKVNGGGLNFFSFTFPAYARVLDSSTGELGECPYLPADDLDCDLIPNEQDLCPSQPQTDLSQTDSDGDGIPDECQHVLPEPGQNLLLAAGIAFLLAVRRRGTPRQSGVGAPPPRLARSRAWSRGA